MQHVLVVDHEPEPRQAVQHALQRTGRYRVSCAASGEQALGVLDRDRPDLVVFDLVMPGMPGIELAAHATERGIPIIVTTDKPELDARLARLGWPYLRKPVDVASLIDECRATIGESRQRLRLVRRSLERLLVTTGQIKDLVAELRTLRTRVDKTLAAARRQRH